MSKITDHLQEIVDALGKDKVYQDKPTRIAHRMAHSPEILLHEGSMENFIPDLVVDCRCTEDVVKIVKIANKYKIPLIPQAGRLATMGSQGRKGAIVVSLNAMDKILDFDEENQLVTVEPGVMTDHLGEFLGKRGYVQVEWPATRSARIGGRVGTDGYNRYQFAIGRTKENVIWLETVLADGTVAELGEGSCRATKSAMGYNLKDLMVGARGTLGIVTKIMLRCYKRPPVEDFGYRAFPSPEDMVRATIEICQDPITSRWIWRLTGTPGWLAERVFPIFAGRPFPEEIGALMDYNVFGDSETVPLTKKRVIEIMERNGGFLSDKLPPEPIFARVSYTNRDIGLNRLVSIVGDRASRGGRGGMWSGIDSAIPMSSALAFCEESRRFLEHWEEFYPSLSKVSTFAPILPINVSPHYIFFWDFIFFHRLSLDREAINEFVKFYREHADMCHRLGGSMTYVHGFAPRAVEIEMIKEEVGEAGYEVMKKIKQALDPNNIMNPYVRFTYEEDPVLQAARRIYTREERENE